MCGDVYDINVDCNTASTLRRHRNPACFEQTRGRDLSTDLAELARVQRRRRARPISNLLGYTISKICALVFLALILVPFTAPFRTFELPSPHSDRSHNGLPKVKIGSDEKLVSSPAVSMGPPALTIVTVKAPARLDQDPGTSASIRRSEDLVQPTPLLRP